MNPPKGLKPRGRALWRSTIAAAPADMELDEREQAYLLTACRLADDEAALERVLKKLGPIVYGSTGQPVLNPAFAELRQCRHAISRHLGLIALPDANDNPATAASERGRRAVAVRHGRDELARRRRESHAS